MKMTFAEFSTMVADIQRASERTRQAYKLGIDLMEFTDPQDRIIKRLGIEAFGEERYETLCWFIYEAECGTNDFKMHDKDGKQLCGSMSEMYEYLKAI